MKRVPLTLQGEKDLKKELEDLKKVKRPKIIREIADARAHGDLKENAEYHAAKEMQGFIEGRIRNIESKLANSQIIDITKIRKKTTVIFGSTVLLYNIDDDEEVTYKIVGEDEADLTKNKISYLSPLARSIISKSVGEEILLRTPKGKVEYEILEVQYI